MDLMIKADSRGIRYDGYDKDFIECIFEDSHISGRNERYEFRCRPDLGCCGRVCCIPQENIIPLWLMILYIALGLLLLLALLGTIFWCLRKIISECLSSKAKKTKTIIDQRPVVNYRSFKQDESQDGLDTEKLIRERRGYRNPLYTATSTVKIRETFARTIDDGSLYEKAGTAADTGTGTGTGGETTRRSQMTVGDSDSNVVRVNTAGTRWSGYAAAEAAVSLPRTVSSVHSEPVTSEHYSTRETYEERCEENFITEEEKPTKHPDTK